MASNDSSGAFMSKLSRYVSNITGSSVYWYKVREDLKAIIACKGAPTIFFTFSSADMHWPELHMLLNPSVPNPTSEERRKNVISNPHLVDWFFTKRLESFLKHWLYDTLDAEWHWYRYEFQARGSIHCHGTAKSKSDPGLCNLSEIALKGFLAEKCADTSKGENILLDIEQGNKATRQICDYVDSIVSTWNPLPPQNNAWTKPDIHPCKKRYQDVSDIDSDYADLLNTVQCHTHCSTKYCLKHSKDNENLHCRFKFPFDLCSKTSLNFEQIHTKDKSVQYKANIVTKRNDPRLNNHQRIQLQGWRGNCDIQVIIDYHAYIEYLCKYAAKGEPRSPMLKDTFNAIMKNVKPDSDPQKAMKNFN